MANYQSAYTGETIEKLLSAVGKYVEGGNGTSVAVSGIAFRQIVWEVAPTTSNQVYGFAIHPTNGKLYRIYNNKGTKSATVYSPNGWDISVDSAANTLVINGAT